jgi:hypothetical protein
MSIPLYRAAAAAIALNLAQILWLATVAPGVA